MPGTVANCRGCGALIDCKQLSDLDLYGLENKLPVELFCPPGFDCSAPFEIRLKCCDQILVISIPLGADADTRFALLNDAWRRCRQIEQDCGGVPDDPQKFFNGPQCCQRDCPNGAAFQFCVQAGIFLADTLAEANALARQFACEQVALRWVCLAPLSGVCCLGSSFSEIISATSGAPITSWQLIGTLPTGLTFHGGVPSSKRATISGTPTASGNFTFSVMVTTALGDVATKSYSICVIEVSPVVATGQVGVAYADMVLVTPCAGAISFSIVSGALPPGLALDAASGVISGTPTTIGSYTFEIGVTTA